MPRPKVVAPKYEYHVSGHARVRMCGKDYYLGPHGSPESLAKYYALLAEYNSNGQQAPKVASDSDGDKEHLEDQPIRIRDVTSDFRHRMLDKMDQQCGHYYAYKRVLDLLEKRHGDETPDQFGPRKLEAIRDIFVDEGLSRSYVNSNIAKLIRVFRHGVRRELVTADRIVALESLPPLKHGECRESKKRPKATIEAIQATLPFLSKVAQDMLKLQLATAMRPSEVFKMTPGQIDRSGDTWFYRPDSHKTEHHGKKKAIPLSSQAIEILQPYLFRDDDELLFWTPRGNPWKKDALCRAVVRACEKAKVERWTPYSLRHLAAQSIRDAIGVEAAAAILGHSRLSTTEIYAQASEALAAKAAAVIPAVG